jgi:L-threonylcarbamoyladenylate synthase
MPEIFQWSAGQGLPLEFLNKIKKVLDDGGIIVFPTNTLYGLGASIYSEIGMERLNEIKKRPPGMPFSIMATGTHIESMCHIPEKARDFMTSGDRRITAILPAGDVAPAMLVHNDTLAVRHPCSELTKSLVEFVGPITATSANMHGMPTPSNIDGIIGQFGDRVQAYIDAGTLFGAPTTMIDYTGPEQRIIRKVAIPGETGKTNER